MSLYSDVENAVKTKLLALSTISFHEDAIGNNIETIYEAIIKKELDFGCWFLMGGGNRPPRETFASAGSKGRTWYWRLGMVFFIAFKGDSDQFETNLRDYIEELQKLLDDDHTLGDIVPFAQMLAIDGPPEETEINDSPFYAFSGTIEFWDKS